MPTDKPVANTGNGSNKKNSGSSNVNNGSNGKPNPLEQDGIMRLVLNQMLSRSEWINRFFSQKRDIYKECDYPQTITCFMYQDLFDRQGIATRVVELLPKESWKVTPEVYEVEEEDVTTPFEEGWQSLGKQLHGERSWMGGDKNSAVWDLLLRSDIQAGIGQYSIIVLTINDGKQLNQPADMMGCTDGIPNVMYHGMMDKGEMNGISEEEETVSEETDSEMESDTEGGMQGKGYQDTEEDGNNEYDGTGVEGATTARTGKKRYRLLCAECFPESLAQVTQWEGNPISPRYGKPIMYKVTFNDPRNTTTSGLGLPLATRDVHWTRVIHIADNIESNKAFGKSRMQHVYNNLLDLQKIYSADGEGFWKSVIAHVYFETHPQLGGQVDVDVDKVRDMVEQMEDGFQRFGLLRGMSAKQLPPQLLDPTPHINAHIEAICIRMGCPVPIFKGYEIGEQASENNDKGWNSRLKHRQAFHITPNILCKFIDRLIALSILPMPDVKGEYYVDWPDIAALDETQKAQLAQTVTTTIATYIQSGAEALLPPVDFFTKILDMDDEEVTEFLTSAAQQAEGTNATDSAGSSPLLSLVGGITGITDLFTKYQEGTLSHESLKQLIMLFYKVDDGRAEQIIADTVPSAQPATPIEPNTTTGIGTDISMDTGEEQTIPGLEEILQ